MKVIEIVEGLKRGSLTPVQIAEHYLHKYEMAEPKVFAWEEYAYEKILEHYHHIDANKINWKMTALQGVPIGVKDCYNSEDFYTRRGSSIYKNYRAGNDARLIRKIKDEGAFVFGKTTTAEMSIHEPSKTLNPYNIKHTPGTSSGGSACAVATGMIPLSVGTQTAASTSKPCSYCGVYGYKPTFGNFPRTGVLKTCDTLDTLTLITNCVEDIEFVFNLLKLNGHNYPLINNNFKENNKTLKKCRIGIITDSKNINSKKFLQNDFESLKNELKQNKMWQVEYIELPNFLNEVHSVHSQIYSKSVSYYFKEEYQKYKDQLSPVLTQMIEYGSTISSIQYQELISKQAAHTIEFQNWLIENFDFIITPATMGPAPAGLHDHSEKDFSLIWTYLGVPLLISPKFMTKEQLPYGFQVCSIKYSDNRLIEFVKELRKLSIISDAKEVVPK